MRCCSRPPVCSGWRRPVCSRLRPAEIVELPATVGVREHVVSFLDLLEFLFGEPVLRIEIRMILPGQLEVSSPDLCLTSAIGYFENSIIVRPNGHRLITPSEGSFATGALPLRRGASLLVGRSPWTRVSTCFSREG